MASGGKSNGKSNWRVELKGKTTRETMLKVVAATLEFPPHFGGNLDALYDCLIDLPLTPGPSYAITLADLARSPAGDSVHTVFADAAEFWRERGVTVRILRD